MAKKGAKGKAKKKKEIKMKEVDLSKYISQKFKDKLSDEFGNACTFPTRMAICTCNHNRENIKIFFIEYETQKDSDDDIVTIYSEEGIAKTDEIKLRNAFDEGKI